MISRKAVKLLKWMRKNDGWCYEKDLKQKFKGYDERLLQAFVRYGLVDTFVDPSDLPDEDGYGEEHPKLQYRVNNYGFWYLEHQAEDVWSEIRSWASLVIALIALVVSSAT